MESLSGGKGDNSVKIIGPDLAELEHLAEQVKNRLSDVSGMVPNLPQTPLTGASSGVSTIGTAVSMPSHFGSTQSGNVNNIASSPRRRLKDLVTPLNDQGIPDPQGKFVRPGASTIYREQGN